MRITNDAGEAERFNQSNDWSTPLVVPMPIDEASYQTVMVDNVEGTMSVESMVEKIVTT